MTMRELGENVNFWLLGLLNILRDGNFGDLTIGQFVFIAVLAGSFLFGTFDFVSQLLKEWQRGREAKIQIGCCLFFVVSLVLLFGSGLGILVAVGFAWIVGLGLIINFFIEKKKDSDGS